VHCLSVVCRLSVSCLSVVCQLSVGSRQRRSADRRPCAPGGQRKLSVRRNCADVGAVESGKNDQYALQARVPAGTKSSPKRCGYNALSSPKRCGYNALQWEVLESPNGPSFVYKRCFRVCDDEGRSHLQSVAAITRCHLQSVAAITRCTGKSWNPQTDLLLYISVASEFAKTRDEVFSKALRL